MARKSSRRDQREESRRHSTRKKPSYQSHMLDRPSALSTLLLLALLGVEHVPCALLLLSLLVV